MENWKLYIKEDKFGYFEIRLKDKYLCVDICLERFLNKKDAILALKVIEKIQIITSPIYIDFT